MQFRKSLLALGMLTGLAQPAWAHISLEQPHATAGSTYKAVLRVPHGCNGEATTAIRVRIPEGVFNVKPMPKPGWTLATVTGDYAKSYDAHGKAVTQGVTEIIWSGGELPDDWYDEFVFRGSIDVALSVDSRVSFPLIQSCGELEEPWIDTSGATDAEMPAPSLTITAAEPGD
jgi:uncharacterized protein YcnI